MAVNVFVLGLDEHNEASSDLAFGVANQQEFQDALAQIRDGIGRIGAPFDTVLEHLELPPEIATVGGQSA